MIDHNGGTKKPLGKEDPSNHGDSQQEKTYPINSK